MEENSARWLALREAGRRILTEHDLDIKVPERNLANWQRLILNIGDSMPQRLQFPTVNQGVFSVKQGERVVFAFTDYEPISSETLWLPYNTDELLDQLIQMCSELLLAGYPGCSGCGYRDEEEEWDETAHRQRIKN
tara:strand:+ start:1290 stop:1697 length:408 start_codon:yes stop_codon:yes gene_type:complete